MTGVAGVLARLPEAQARRGQMPLTELAARPNETRFLHRDYIPDNLFITGHGVRAIDPYGMVGDRARDLASFACRSSHPPGGDGSPDRRLRQRASTSGLVARVMPPV